MRRKKILYKVRFTGYNNPNLSPREECLKSSLTMKELHESLGNACTMPHSIYYGYTGVVITKIKDVPEIAQVKINV